MYSLTLHFNGNNDTLLLNGILPVESFHGKTYALPSIWEIAMEIAIEIAMEMDHGPNSPMNSHWGWLSLVSAFILHWENSFSGISMAKKLFEHGR